MITDSELSFIAEASRHAQTLPVGQCARFIRGVIEALGEEHPAVPRFRRAVAGLMDSDQQLELIQIGQLKLNLVSRNRRKRR